MEITELLTKPEFYDLFGLPIFIFISLLSGWMLWKKRLPNRKIIWMLLIIGITGLIVDGICVTTFGSLFSIN